MFAGKTNELIRRIKRAMIAKKSVQIFKPIVDDRYEGVDRVCTHDGICVDATPVHSASQIILSLDYKNLPDVIAIDEAQFFDDLLIFAVDILANEGARVIVAGTDTTFAARAFGPMGDIMCLAEEITKLNAICVKCGGVATRNQRMVDGKPASIHSPEIMVGDNNTYEARCRSCYEEPK